MRARLLWSGTGVLLVISIIGIAFANAQPPSSPSQSISEENSLRERFINKLLSFSLPPLPVNKPPPPPSGMIAPSQIKLYERIFTHQKAGDMAQADQLIKQLTDTRLMGHVLYQRYMHPTAYISSFAELQDWMGSYADHPGAQDIYKLALRKVPGSGAGYLAKPQKTNSMRGYLDARADFRETYVADQHRTRAQQRVVRNLRKKVRNLVRRGRPTQALAHLNDKKKSLDQIEYNTLRSRVAAGYMYLGHPDKAYRLSKEAAEQSGINAPLAGWIAGLSAWREEKYEEASLYFEMAARSPYANGWTISSAAFWASRSHMRTGNFKAVSFWLNRATDFPRTFYGLIALKALGKEPDFYWQVPAWEGHNQEVLLSHPAGLRAVGLQQSGQYVRAEHELSRINASGDDKMKTALLAFSVQTRMPSLAWRMAAIMPQKDGSLYDAALYPLLPWEPQEGYKIDRALIHAMIRQESRFDIEAGNPSGATGLMQLMPATARAMVGKNTYREAGGIQALKDPLINLQIGQKYIHQIFDNYVEDRDLFSLMIAWNAGPGNLRKWKKRLAGIEDPLLFIESIPAYETRAFVERVMANYWIYRYRFGQAVPSLENVAAGKWARYDPQESKAGVFLAEKD